MNTDQLIYLIELSKHTSMSSASKTLHLTPQALSMAIKKLEEELGFALLNRCYKGISLTADGKWLVERASLFLDDIATRQQHYQQNESQAHHSGELRIFQNDTGINNSIMGEFVCNLYQKNPDLHVQLFEVARETILSQILAQELNLGLIFRTTVNDTPTDILDDSLVFEPLFDGELVFMTAENSELAKFNSVSFKKAVQFPLCNYFVHYSTALRTQDFFNELLGTPPNYTNENNYSIFKEKILRGLANCCTIHFSVDEHPINYIEGTKIIPIRENVKIYFGLVYHKNSHFTANEHYFIQELKRTIMNAQ